MKKKIQRNIHTVFQGQHTDNVVANKRLNYMMKEKSYEILIAIDLTY